MGVRERESYQTMAHAKQTRRVTPASSKTLMNILETLPGALFVVEDADTVVYTNAIAQAMSGALPEACIGNSFWRGASLQVTTTLYQAVRPTRQTLEPTEVEHCSP